MNALYKNKKYLLELILTVSFLAVALYILTNFLNYVETRNGVTLNDPLLNNLPIYNLTWFIFTILYSILTISTIYLIKNPEELLMALQMYILMVISRMVFMYFLPLDPPSGMIILKDPFVEFLGTQRTLTKDLFFSGHTSTMLIFILSIKNKVFKYILSLVLLVVISSILLQHVHYTIDILTAFAVTFLIYYILKKYKTYNFK